MGRENHTSLRRWYSEQVCGDVTRVCRVPDKEQILLYSVVAPCANLSNASHSWSDGIGNDDKTNSLWACQLSRIQSLLNELYSEPHRALDHDHAQETSREDGMVPFWLDTLCVPVGYENRHPGGDAKRDLRKE